jgi:hypothetical protein
MDHLLLEDHFYFNAIASALVVFICFLLSKSSKTKDYVGFIYLFGIPLKGVFYYKRFPFLFSEKLALGPEEKVSILMPMLLFLAVEVLFLSKILKQSPSEQI